MGIGEIVGGGITTGVVIGREEQVIKERGNNNMIGIKE